MQTLFTHRKGHYYEISFPNGSSTYDLNVDNRYYTGFISVKAISSNDSGYALYPVVWRDDGVIGIGTALVTSIFYDLSVSIAYLSLDTIRVTISDGGAGGTTGGTLIVETLLF